jgi:hypothetical protein
MLQVPRRAPREAKIEATPEKAARARRARVTTLPEDAAARGAAPPSEPVVQAALCCARARVPWGLETAEAAAGELSAAKCAARERAFSESSVRPPWPELI